VPARRIGLFTVGTRAYFAGARGVFFKRKHLWLLSSRRQRRYRAAARTQEENNSCDTFCRLASSPTGSYFVVERA
jgi:hypothetical protein